MNRKSNNEFDGGRKAKGSKKFDENGQVHRRNLRLVAIPITCVMGILRLIALQLWIIISFLWMKLPRTKDSEAQTSLIEQECTATYSGSRANSPKRSSNSSEAFDMYAERRVQVGAGEPALSKQKHHHRRAFEYISKALKLDEEDEGFLIFLLSFFSSK